MVMDVVATDKIRTMEEEKVGPPGPCSGQSCSRYSMSRTCGPCYRTVCMKGLDILSQCLKPT
jgi:hypothetical protein